MIEEARDVVVRFAAPPPRPEGNAGPATIDLSGIPKGSVISSATLSRKTPLGIPDHGAWSYPVDLFEVTRPWTEGSVTCTRFNGALDGVPEWVSLPSVIRAVAPRARKLPAASPP
ncbi:hypothetical protein [Sorangium sp. So ce1097]|uniref:hypothetical protein n=1 Tax=Sorangium sp. So ce1097 TaxID=3133330 RepID=UPI003F61FB27